MKEPKPVISRAGTALSCLLMGTVYGIFSAHVAEGREQKFTRGKGSKVKFKTGRVTCI